jgi:hypothetical protein
MKSQTIAWIDSKTIAVVHWKSESEASFDGLVLWNNTTIEPFLWIYMHLLKVGPPRHVTIRNSQYVPPWILHLLPRFEWSGPMQWILDYEEGEGDAVRSFGRRLAAILVGNLLPAWKQASEESFVTLLLETNEVAHNALSYFVPFPTLAVCIAEEIRGEEDRKRVMPYLIQQVKQWAQPRGMQRSIFLYLELVHGVLDRLIPLDGFGLVEGNV